VNNSDKKIYCLFTEFESLEKLYDKDLVSQGIKISYKNYIYDLDPHANRRHVKTGSTKALEIYIEEICETKNSMFLRLTLIL